MAITTEDYETIIRIVEERVREIKVTREDFNKLVEAHKRAEERLSRVERAVSELTESVRELSKSVGALSDNIGYGLEDIARVVLPGYLYKHFSIEISDLQRKFIEVRNEYIEINLYGEGKRNGEKIIVLGESKSRISERDVEKFVQDIGSLELKDKTLKLMFGYFIHPLAQKKAKENDIILVASYQR